ncbi:arabinose efflux permease [Acetobacter cibinongensis NRIC 0482]|nr:arabinose efflux permease [Acetobacter cibinongensis NRIC 0482]
MTIPGMMAAVSAPGVMLFSGRTDRRRIVLWLSFILLAGCLIATMAPSFAVLLLSRALIGISLGAFWAMGLSVAVELVAQERAHKAAAAVFAGVTAAMILGVPMGSLVAEYSSWRGAFVAAALIAVGAFLAQWRLLPAVPAQSHVRLTDFKAFIRLPEARKSIVMIAAVFAAHFAAYTYLAPLIHEAGIPSEAVTVLLLAYGVIGFASNLVASRFLENNLKATLFASKISLVIPFLFLPVLVIFPKFETVLILLWAVAWGALPLCLNTWHRSIETEHSEAAAAMFTLTAQIAIAVGSSLGGVVVDHFGLKANFWMSALIVILSALYLATHRKVE